MRWGLRDVTVSFGGAVALDAVDTGVEGGSILAVIGPDGAGKTTLARAQVGLVPVERGRVVAPPRASIGYKPENSGAWSDLTVGENLEFVATTHHLGDDAEDRIAMLLDVTGLAGARNRLAANLSGGMHQKLAVAMAMVARPRLLVLDEPTTGLDPISRVDVWRLLARAAREGAAIVVTTTYLDEAQRADDVVVLDRGSVLLHGTARDLQASFPGHLVATHTRDPHHPSWRRGRTWRTWLREGTGDDVTGDSPSRGRALEPDMEDVVMAAALTRSERGR
jgi:ABC-2 type transport system ATP-binding protein